MAKYEKSWAELNDEERLCLEQRRQIIELITQFVNENKPREALALIERVDWFNPDTLKNIMKVVLSNHDLKSRATSIFRKHLDRADESNVRALLHVYDFSRSTEARGLYSYLLEKRLSQIAPEWEKTQKEPTKGSTGLQEHRAELMNTPITDITSLEDCIYLANTSRRGDDDMYFQRFLELGGNPEDEEYLKAHVNVILNRKTNNHRPLLGHLRRLSKQMSGRDFLKFLREKIATKAGQQTKGTRGTKVERVLLEKLLVAFAEFGHDHLQREDWLFLAEYAIRLKDKELKRICYEHLKMLVRTPEESKIYSALMLQMDDGSGPILSRPQKSFRNPIFGDVNRKPINKAAALALYGWARHKVHDEEDDSNSE
ncbi:hypothetical protein HYW18_03170 [Candidatus Uhrbacteria bacterium]|nr:hypothetical protein [Candidatus Uhrbacteria bacterium]